MQHGVNDESIRLLLFLKEKEKAVRKGGNLNTDRLSVLFSAYRKKIFMCKETGYTEAVKTLQLALMTGPSNACFTDYCLERGLFYNLTMIVRCYADSEGEVLSEAFMDELEKKTGRNNKKNLLPLYCQIQAVLPERKREELAEMIKKKPEKCTVRGLYYVLSDFSVRFSPSIRDHFMESIRKTDAAAKKRADLSNPLYALIRLFKEGCIPSAALFPAEGAEEDFIELALYPEKADLKRFGYGWWKLLTPLDLKKILSDPERQDFFEEIMSVDSPEFCSVKALACSLRKDLAFRRMIEKDEKRRGIVS